MTPDISFTEIKQRCKTIAEQARELLQLAELAHEKPDALTPLDASKMSFMATGLGCKVNTLDYLMQGNQRPVTGERRDGGITKTIPLPVLDPHV